MKVYLLTFHGSVNYGAVLQALALSKTLGSLGYACEVIDYNRELHHKNFLKSYSKSFKGKLYQALQYPQKFKLHKKFDNFIKANMPLSSKAYNGFGALSSEVFDENAAFIVGSDQVWNCELTENNYHYFLDFTASENKFSYAASFGVSDISGWENKARVLELLQQFKSISVREESGAEIIKKELNRESTVVCDPTFLLEKSDWEQVASLNDRGKYVLLFMLSYNKDLHERARELKNTLLGLSEVKIDALVNCIGMSRGDAFRYTEAEDFDAVMQTNIKSTYLISQVFANYFIENSIEGNILNISSVSGIRPANTPYMISKWGMNGLTKGMAKQLIKYGIVVNGIAPGPTATEMLRLDGSNLSYEGAPAKRFTAPAEVGNLAVFLLSDMARMIVGETIAISGGCGNLTYDDIPY